MAKWVYSFGDGEAEGKAEMRNLLGGKGANLAEMANLGLPVPPGFTITTEVCTYYYGNGRTYPEDLVAQMEGALAQVERTQRYHSVTVDHGAHLVYRQHPICVAVECSFVKNTSEGCFWMNFSSVLLRSGVS